MDGSVHNRKNLEKVTQAYFSLEKRASPWGSPEVSTPIQYTTAQALRKLLRRTLVKKSGPVPGPWGSPEVSTPIQYTTAQALRKLLKRTLVKKSGPVPGPWGSLEVSTPVQYTTAQDMFGCRHGRFSTQPHKICLGVGIDGSVHNRSYFIVTQAYFKRKASSVLHLRSIYFALVPGGV